MQNFTYHNPTRIEFGRGTIAKLAELVPSDARIMMTWGGGSILRNGVHEQVIKALGGRTVVEFSGIEPNPQVATLMKAIDLARGEKIDFLLAVGGGSVIDGTKLIAAALGTQDVEPWQLVLDGGGTIKAAPPIGTVLTLPATGTEMNGNSVISRAETAEKRAFTSPLVLPVFSILDPETTFTLPARQIANGVVDAFMHVTEQYLTTSIQTPMQDRQAEAVMRTLIEVGPLTLANPDDYDARASMMWAATQALNGLLACGVDQDWATHMIGHELTAAHGLDHAQTLAVVGPSLWRHQRDKKHVKLLQFARRVWGIDTADEEAAIDEGIAQTVAFFESLGVPTRLGAHGIGEERFEHIATQATANGNLGEHGDIGPKEALAILNGAV